MYIIFDQNDQNDQNQTHSTQFKPKSLNGIWFLFSAKNSDGIQRTCAIFPTMDDLRPGFNEELKRNCYKCCKKASISLEPALEVMYIEIKLEMGGNQR